MTLKEAQKKWNDAVQLKVKHAPHSVTEEQLVKWAGQSWNDPIKPLSVRVGKTTSSIIYSRQAAKEENQLKIN